VPPGPRTEFPVEVDVKEPSGVTRGQNAVHVMPMDWSTASSVVAALLDRIDPSRAETQLIVLTSDGEGATTASNAIVSLVGDRDISVLPATASPRASRLLRSAPAHVVSGAPADLVSLLQSSALKPQGVRAVLFAWLDPILGTPDAASLENLLSELPKEGARVVLAGELNAAYETLIERYARRARRAVETPAEPGASLSVEYVTTTPAARVEMLRRVLDVMDFPRAEIFARSQALRDEALRVGRALGYAKHAVALADPAAEAGTDPLILLELPTTKEEIRALAGTKGRKLYALVPPSQLGSLRALTSGGTLSPLTLLEATERARGKDAAVRGAIRETLSSGDLHRELLTLEPLLAEFDGIEIAAATLRMLEQQRPSRPAAATTPSAPMQKLFVNVGERDGARAQEIIALITSEAGIPGSQVGRIEVRDTHSIVEVAEAAAQLVVGKLTGAALRGRKVQARMDQPRDARAPRGERSPRPFDKSDRGARRGPPQGGARRNDRERPNRDRNDRPGRPRGPRHET